ncbi:hypothetical protein GGX14DRAFT_568712 [Mycena pura]|uniref:Uncharacterized protein n=1 Tax=Mycena pura TaxID=153505 RepID=A0AAD6V8A0_9AGAR|nr:hypothetical protein GGX14DRAFT_568712 [Mycena pura]
MSQIDEWDVPDRPSSGGPGGIPPAEWPIKGPSPITSSSAARPAAPPPALLPPHPLPAACASPPRRPAACRPAAPPPCHPAAPLPAACSIPPPSPVPPPSSRLRRLSCRLPPAARRPPLPESRRTYPMTGGGWAIGGGAMTDGLLMLCRVMSYDVNCRRFVPDTPPSSTMPEASRL